MPTATYTPIQTLTLASSANSVTFTSVSGYRDVVIVVEGSTASSGRSVLRMNGDTGSNYEALMISDGDYAATSSGTYIDPMPGYSITGQFSAIWQIFDVSETDKYKSAIIRLNQHAGAHIHLSCGNYKSTSAITSYTILTSNGVSYTSGTTFSMYGVIA